MADVSLAALAAQVFTGLVLGGIFVLLAIGLSLIFGLMTVVNFSHGALYMLGAYFGFVLLTRMHERYMFVSLALLAALAFARPLRRSYVALSGLFLLNLWYPFAFFNSQWGVEDFHDQPWFPTAAQ